MPSLFDAVQAYVEQEGLFRTEGRQGLINLCKLVGALGYRDQFKQGQLDSTTSIGDLVLFLEDNPGAIEAITTWISNQNSPEWHASLNEVVDVVDAEFQEDEDD